MTLQQLTYFLAAASHKSFSAAADSLLLSQPSPGPFQTGLLFTQRLLQTVALDGE